MATSPQGSKASGFDIDARWQCVKSSLGFAYSRKNHSIRTLATTEFENKDISYPHFEANFVADIAADLREASSRLEKRVGFNLNIGAPQVGGGVGLNYSQNTSTSDITKTLYCVAVVFARARCLFAKIPSRDPDYSATFDDDGYVHSGHVYSHFTVVIQLETESHEKRRGKSLGGKAQISAFKQLVNADLSANKDREDIEKRTITHIRITNTPSHGSFPELPSWQDMQDYDKFAVSFMDIRNRFREDVSTFQNLSFAINEEEDVKPIKDLVQKTLLDEFLESEERCPKKITGLPNENLLDKDILSKFQILAAAIQMTVGNSSTNLLKDIGLFRTLQGINDVFGVTFKNFSTQPNSNVLVIGKLKSGKSLLIGYLLGKKLKRDPNTLKYSYAEQQKDDAPIIGNTERQAGTQVFGNFIEAEGLLDLDSSDETELCNMVALDIVSKSKRPNRVLITLSAGVFNNGALEFIDIIRKLGKIIKDPFDKDSWQSIHFVINDDHRVNKPGPNQPIDEKYIQEQITTALTSYRTELERNLPGYREPSVLEYIGFIGRDDSVRFPESKSVAQIRETMKDDKVIRTLAENVEALQLMLQYGKIVFANFEGDLMRKKLSRWLDGSNLGDASVSFNIDNKYRKNIASLIKAFNYIIDYFNQQFTDKEDLQNHLTDIKTYLESENEDKMETTDPFTDKIDKLKRDLGDLESRRQGKKAELESTKQALIEEKANPMAVSPWKDLDPNPSITHRCSLHKLFCGPQISTFKYTDSVPIVDADPQPKSLSGDAQWLHEIKDLKNGVYQIEYQPASHSRDVNFDATVKLYIRRKDLPEVKANIESYENKIRALESDLTEMENKIRLQKARIKDTSLAIRVRATDYNNKLDKLKKVSEEHNNLLIDASNHFLNFREFCLLIIKTIEQLKNTYPEQMESLNPRKYKTFTENIQSFNKDKNKQPTDGQASEDVHEDTKKSRIGEHSSIQDKAS